MQELLEVLGIPYTGSRRVGLHPRLRQGAGQARDARPGIPTPDFFAFNETAFRELGAAQALPAIEERLRFPIVVKPARQGSALGIKFARTPADVPAALVAAFSYDRKVLLERYVRGRELAVSILEDADGAPARRCRSSRRCPSRRTSTTSSRATRSGAPGSSARPSSTRRGGRAGQRDRARGLPLLGCSGFARVDLMLDAETDELYVLELNPIPGLTETSLLPQAAEAAGICFDELDRARSLGRASPAGRASCQPIAAGDPPVRAARPPVGVPPREAAYSSEAKSSGRDLVEEVLELLDDLFGVLDLVLELDRGLGDDLVGGEDRGAGAHGQGQRVQGRESISRSRPSARRLIEA